MNELEEKNINSYKQINSSSEILEEIKKILVTEKNIDPNCISVYDLSRLFKENFDNYSELKDYYETLLINTIENQEKIPYHPDKILLKNFDKNKNEITISFAYRGKANPKLITFGKKNNDLYIKESDLSKEYTQALLDLLGNTILKMIDNLSTSPYNIVTEDKNIQAVNTNFYVNFYLNRMKILTQNNEFKLSFLNHKNDYECDCNSNNVLNVVNEMEDEIFKNIFIKIDDCPEWMQKQLYDIRQEQLKERKLSFFERMKDYIKNISNLEENNSKQK